MDGLEKNRALNQRALVHYWMRIEAVHKIPHFEDFDPESPIHDPKRLAVWNVEQTNGHIVFRALYSGRSLNEPFDSAWTGKTLEELTPPSLRADIVKGSQDCVSKTCAVYMILRTRDDRGNLIDLERLLLPFGRNGQVEQIVASLRLTSLAGSVDRKGIVHEFETRSKCVLSVCIPHSKVTDSIKKIAGRWLP